MKTIWTLLCCVALTVALTPNGDGTVGADLEGFVDSLGNARWFRFAVQPGAEVRIDLTSLPEDYDLAVFTDIDQNLLGGPESISAFGEVMRRSGA